MSLTQRDRTYPDGVASKKLYANTGAGAFADAVTWVDENGVVVSADPFGIRVGNSEIAGYELIDKFGHNHEVGATLAPIAAGGVWPTPQAASATQLRVKAGNANDTAAGTGAREITIFGIDATGAEVTETIATAGISASANTTNSYMRIWRAFISAAGSYASSTVNSQAGNIVIESAAGTQDWLLVEIDGLVAQGQSQVAMYTVPLTKKAYITSYSFGIDSAKTPDLALFQRQNILESVAPYTARRVLRTWGGIEGQSGPLLSSPLGPFPALTDLGSMAVISSLTAKVSVNMTILQMDE